MERKTELYYMPQGKRPSGRISPAQKRREMEMQELDEMVKAEVKYCLCCLAGMAIATLSLLAALW